MATILCVDDEASVIALLRKTLERMGHAVLEAGHAAAAIDLLGRQRVDLVITDFAMPGIDGLELLRLARDEGHDPPFIMLTGHASIEHAVAAIKAGAIDYLAKPFRAAQLELAVTAGLDVARLRRENAALREEVARLRPHRELLGGSVAVRQLLDTAATAAPTRATVLLLGESGTGKEVLARTIHGWSDRADRPFIQVNCAALPDGLIESALFGHEKGAFTGALKRTPGAFERADDGTLLLDEVTEMRIDLQAKLLRVLQEQEFERVGGTEPIRVNVRVIATSNRDLESAVAEGSFRQDLYYRLAVIPLRLPPLRERREDIPLLARHFAARAAEQAGRPVPTLLPEAIAWLSARDWPGNVRELQHAVERAVILSPGPTLGPRAFAEGPARALTALAMAPVEDEATAPATSGTEQPPTAASGSAVEASPGALSEVRLRSLALAEAEAVLIQAALTQTGGNRTKAAALLGITDRTLRNKLNPKARPTDT